MLVDVDSKSGVRPVAGAIPPCYTELCFWQIRGRPNSRVCLDAVDVTNVDGPGLAPRILEEFPRLLKQLEKALVVSI